MPHSSLVRRILLPELELTNSWFFSGHDHTHLEVRKTSRMEVCPRCATPSTSIYDHRVATVRDAPIRDRQVVLHIHKRRFSCKPCGKPFTEPVPGIRKRARFTERFKRAVLWACETFSDLKSVRRAFRSPPVSFTESSISNSSSNVGCDSTPGPKSSASMNTFSVVTLPSVSANLSPSWSTTKAGE